MLTFHMPVKILMGENVVDRYGNELILGKKAIIVTGRSSGAKSGALADVTAVLERYGVSYIVYDKIGNNPTIEETAEGGKCAKEFGADFIIGIGGGSPLDAAKAIAVYAVNEPKDGSNFELYDIFDRKYKNKPLPMAAIPTTAGTGSEATPYSILTLHKEQTKRNFSDPEVFYKVAFLDGRYNLGLPLQVARNTAIDTLSHLIEGFTNKKASAVTDYIALEGLKILAKNFKRLKNGDFDVQSCTELLWAATLGGMVISHTGTTIVHSMGYPMTYFKDIPHGMANGLLLAEYLRKTEEVLPGKVKQCLEILGIKDVDGLSVLLRELLPCDAEFNAEELEKWTESTIKAKNVALCPFDVTAEDEAEMYKSSLIN